MTLGLLRLNSIRLRLNATLEQSDDIWVFHGNIYYADLNGTVYRTSFWREYNFETRRFVATDNTEYENAN